MKKFANTLSLLTTLIITVIGYAPQAQSLPITHYAEQSELSSGKWVKISTNEQGIHRIDAETLRSWGFTDATQVSVYGQDGYMLPETFSNEDSDDLQAIPTYTESGDLYFFASGSTQWEKQSENNWTHTNNYYSDITFYFLTEDRTPTTLQSVPTAAIEGTAITTFDDYALHEKEDICIGQTGRLYLGEDLKLNNTVSLSAPGITGDKMTIYLALGANTSSTYTIITQFNSKALSPYITIGSSDSYTYLKEAKRTYTVNATENFDLSFQASGSGSLNSFYLDYIRIFYTRKLEMNEAQINFRRANLGGDYYAIDIADHNAKDIRVWNVTDVNNPFIRTTNTVDNTIAFTPDNNSECQEYVAFDITDATLPTPQYVCNVEPQNLHGLDYIPDMVIVTTRYFMKEAERIAQLHRDIDNMKVLVCDQMNIFNEFSGGTPDATAVRRMMKMFYDRAQAGYGNAPRYLLFYGRGSYNNRALAPSLHNEDNVLLVTYQSTSSTDQRYSYVTDDYFGMLDDASGVDISAEALQLSIGRMPIKNLEESQHVYQKLYNYIHQKPVSNLWKNKACFIGLNGDNNLHIRQVNNVSTKTLEKNQEYYIVDKVYLAAYNSTATESFIGAQEQIFRDLEEGAFIYDYMGHAGHISIGTNLINISHAKAMNNKLLPVFITATCDVCPFDKDENSVGEELFRNPNGGFIALFTTARTVYTSGNESINNTILQNFFTPGEDGKVRIGDIMRKAKNDLLYNSKGQITSDPNKLKYLVIGDPALALPIPTHNITVETINGENTAEATMIEAPAGSKVTITGKILDTNGNVATDFNGTLCYEVYDALCEESANETIQTSNGTTVISEKFYTRPYKLVTAADTIIGGEYTATFILPEQCLQSDLTGLISLYAYNNEMTTEAQGFNKDIHIYGTASTTPDVTAPTISNLWIGDDSFCEGDIVTPNTLFHCDIADEESGLANNELSIGKTMVLWLDGKIVCNDLSGHFSPSTTFGKGSIDYTLTNLTEGTHSVTVKIFDNAGNSSESTTTFVVMPAVTEQYDINIAEDPIITQATLSLDGVVENDMTIRYIVVNSATGNTIWSNETNATEVVWNIVPTIVLPGEYECYAIIKIGNECFVTENKKIIILGQ